MAHHRTPGDHSVEMILSPTPVDKLLMVARCPCGDSDRWVRAADSLGKRVISPTRLVVADEATS